MCYMGRRRWVDNVKRDVRDLGLERALSERVKDKIRQRGTVVSALGSSGLVWPMS